MNTFSNLTTATEIQRDYKGVSRRARISDDALIVMLNNKPDLVVMNYDLYKQRFQKDDSKIVSFPSANDELLSLAGSMSDDEADRMIKDMDEMFENIDENEWK